MKKILIAIAILLIPTYGFAWSWSGGGSSSGVNTTYDANSDSKVDSDKVDVWSGSITDEQLLCGENTDGTNRMKSCGAKTTYTEPSTNTAICRTGSATTGACTNASPAVFGNLTGYMPPVVVLLSSGVHDGADDAAIMTDGGIDIGADTLIGMTVYNITDGSSCTITDNAATTITCTLAGGTDNNWDTNDVWQVGPGPNQSGSMFYVAGATTIRHPATVGYVACYMADGTNKLTIDMASDSMVPTVNIGTTVTVLDAGDSIDSSDTTVDDFMCLQNKSATSTKSLGYRGTWADGGAS